MNLKTRIFLYLFVPLLLTVVVFQNCKVDSPTAQLPSELPTGPGKNQTPSTTTSTTSASVLSTSSTTTSNPYERGSLIAYLSSEDLSKAKDQFAVNSTVKFDFQGIHPDSKKFKWAVKKGFDLVGDLQETVDPQYQFDFATSGNYDIFAASYAQDSEVALTKAQKRMTVGDTCTQDVLEILLTSGSLIAGQTAAFSLENSSAFSSIAWKITLPSLKVVEGEGENVTVNFERSGVALVEVVATGVESQCPSSRRKRFQVSAKVEPHFQSVRLVDSDNSFLPATLENNNIYKYTRPADGSSIFLSLDIQNAHTCAYTSGGGSENPVSCSNGRIDVTPAAQGCVENRVTITATYQGSSKQKSYYYYCSSNDCFFGPTEFQPNHHVCTSSPTTTTTLPACACASGSSQCDDSGDNHPKGDELFPTCCEKGYFHPYPRDTDEEYKWSCKPRAAGKATVCRTVDSPTWYQSCKKAKSQNGQCNNTVKWGCRSSASATNRRLYGDGGYDTWHCPGSNGGTPAADCKKCNTTGGHYGGSNCLPSCGHARTLYCESSDCTGFSSALSGNTCLSTSGYTVIRLRNYQGLCCIRKRR